MCFKEILVSVPWRWRDNSAEICRNYVKERKLKWWNSAFVVVVASVINMDIKGFLMIGQKQQWVVFKLVVLYNHNQRSWFNKLGDIKEPGMFYWSAIATFSTPRRLFLSLLKFPAPSPTTTTNRICWMKSQSLSSLYSAPSNISLDAWGARTMLSADGKIPAPGFGAGVRNADLYFSISSERRLGSVAAWSVPYVIGQLVTLVWCYVQRTDTPCCIISQVSILQ